MYKATTSLNWEGIAYTTSTDLIQHGHKLLRRGNRCKKVREGTCLTCASRIRVVAASEKTL